METEMNKALSWEIENFPERKNVIKSEPFSSGGCEWYLVVYPKGCRNCGHLALFLEVVHPDQSARLGWKRRAQFCFVLLNQSGKELYRSPGKDLDHRLSAQKWIKELASRL